MKKHYSRPHFRRIQTLPVFEIALKEANTTLFERFERWIEWWFTRNRQKPKKSTDDIADAIDGFLANVEDNSDGRIIYSSSTCQDTFFGNYPLVTRTKPLTVKTSRAERNTSASCLA